ncbi:unnamed protein product [Lupinus luteus]|uniref:Uncharacterized protein n=1 Tax=Lupinus luteus TaxID=3873 RepID=A0AAV1YJ10_LUPLU
MSSTKPLIPWSFLLNFPDEQPHQKQEDPKPLSQDPAHMEKKSSAQVLSNGNDISLSQLPQPCVKGDVIVVKISKEEYQAGLNRCKAYLHDRLILAKRDTPIKFLDLKARLMVLWNKIDNW